MKKNKIILVDGTLYLYRSYYRFYKLNDILINVIYGMLKLIKNIIYLYKPKYLSIIYDYPHKNFRKILFSKYKINRKSCPKNLINQIPIINKILLDMGINTISIPSVESDDIIGTLSKQCERNGFEVIILTIDKDMSQLINNNIKVNDIFSYKKLLGPKEIYLKYNIYPNQIIDYFSLIGDLSDNIPGIKGIGPKTAKILIKKFKNINNILLNINKIKTLNIKNSDKIVKNLKNNKNKLYLFYKLIKINTDVFTGYTINDLKIKNNNINNIKKIIKKYEILYNKYIN